MQACGYPACILGADKTPVLGASVLNAGALCSLSSLTRLRELRLGDVDGNNPDDVETVCNLVSQLTSLHMGYCPRLQVGKEAGDSQGLGHVCKGFTAAADHSPLSRELQRTAGRVCNLLLLLNCCPVDNRHCFLAVLYHTLPAAASDDPL